MKHQVSLSIIVALGIAALALTASSSYAATGAELAQKNNGIACHGVDKNNVAPSLQRCGK